MSDHAIDARRLSRRIVTRATCAGLAVHMILPGSPLAGRASQSPDDVAGLVLVDASFAELREARTATPLRPMPLVVLSAGQIEPTRWPEGWPLEEQTQLHAALQEDLAGLVPGGRLVVAEQSGHYVHQTQPDLVLDAIRQVVEAVRAPTTWGTPSATRAM